MVAIYWLLVLLPGSTDLARNPASLAYRGPDRLLDAFTSSVPTALIAATGFASIAVGAVGELRRRMVGPWVSVAAWTTITLGLVAASIATGAATDYPRFVTPVLAPLVIGAAGGLTLAVARAVRWIVARMGRGTAPALSLAVVVAAIALITPAAVGGFEAQANGYRLAAPAELTEVARWIDANVPTDSTILAPAREGKWLEGLTGRAALFSSDFRYSFRADEWQRSLAATTLVATTGALVNEFFFARFGDGLAVSANHGGEFVSLLSLVPAGTQILDPSGGVLAGATSLKAEPPTNTLTNGEASVVRAWSGKHAGAALSYHQAVTLLRDSATLEVRGIVSTTLPIGGLQMELRPGSGFPASSIVIDGNQATVTFPRLGSSQPQLLVTIGGQAGVLTALPNGGLGIRSPDLQIRLLITDLTAAPSPTMGLQLLQPAELIDRYHVAQSSCSRTPRSPRDCPNESPRLRAGRRVRSLRRAGPATMTDTVLELPEPILIVGGYGYRNVGDEAILAGLLERLAHRRVTVVSRSPEETSPMHGVRSVSIARALPELFRHRSLIIGGGGLFGRDMGGLGRLLPAFGLLAQGLGGPSRSSASASIPIRPGGPRPCFGSWPAARLRSKSATRRRKRSCARRGSTVSFGRTSPR